MQRILLLFTLLLCLSACSKKAVDKVEMTDEIQHQINAGQFLDDWHKAAGEADFDAYFNAIAQNGFYVGTDEREVWTKEQFAAFSKPFFDKGRAWDFTPKERTMVVSPTENYVWFNETLDTWMGVCRGSGVLSYTEEDGFKIQQYVLSLTVPNPKMRDVIHLLENDNNAN